MSLDKSLKSRNSLIRHRNVLTRSERMEKLQEAEVWPEGHSVLGLPKVVHRKAAVAKKGKAKTEEAAVATEAAGVPVTPAAPTAERPKAGVERPKTSAEKSKAGTEKPKASKGK